MQSLIWAAMVAIVALPAVGQCQTQVATAQLEAAAAPSALAEHRVKIRPRARTEDLPRTRWSGHGGTELWTRSALGAVRGHGAALAQTLPTDIGAWCAAYPTNDIGRREAFWVGLISALVKHESTYRPRVSGDSGRSHGLLQIRSGTARAYGCRATSRAALYNPSENLSCGVRIMAKTVARDTAVARQVDGARGGAGADWGPFVQRAKREDMQAWLRRQSYCVPLRTIRPRLRPEFSQVVLPD